MNIEVGQVLNGKYRIVRRIGAGGMATVYEAQHTGLGTSLAVKVLLPELARGPFSTKAREFLSAHGLAPSDVGHWFGHPGGPAVIDAIEDGLGLAPGTLDASRRTLARVGNLSSASVLVLLHDALHCGTASKAGDGLLYAMGPGFCSELVLLRAPDQAPDQAPAHVPEPAP